MSYDFLVMKLRRPVSSVMEIDSEDAVWPLGTTEEIRALIGRVWPDTNWSMYDDGIWKGTLVRGSNRLDFILGRAGEVITCVRFRSRFGSVNHDVIDQICESTGWTALDEQKGTLRGANIVHPHV